MDGYTHEYITKTAISILREIEPSKIYCLDTAYDWLVKFCTQPDKDETDGAFKHHFYNPATGKNFKSENSSALFKFISHYRKSVNSKRISVEHCNSNDDIVGAYSELGRSIHFLQDMCTPVHVYYEDMFDATTRLAQHIKFESKCNEKCEELGASYFNNLFIYKDFFKFNDIKYIAKNSACKSSILFYFYDNTNNDNHSKTIRDNIRFQSIKNGVIYTLGILYKYYLD